MLPEKQQVVVTNPRYTVVPIKNGHSIVDSTGKDKPYPILIPDIWKARTSEELERSLAHNKQVCEGWAYVWNIVEMGYCGACQHKFAEGEQRYPAVGFHSLDRWICFYCACSQED